jgi:copper chaperone CopZ
MKVQNIINCLEKIYGDELIMPYHIDATNHAIAFFKKYQERLNELEKAKALVDEARLIIRSEYSYRFMEEIQQQIDTLTSFYDDGENPLEEL